MVKRYYTYIVKISTDQRKTTEKKKKIQSHKVYLLKNLDKNYILHNAINYAKILSIPNFPRIEKHIKNIQIINIHSQHKSNNSKSSKIHKLSIKIPIIFYERDPLSKIKKK